MGEPRRWMDYGTSGTMPPVEVVPAADYDALRARVESEYRKGHAAGQEAAMESVAALRARVAELEAALRAVVARLDQPVFRGDEKAGSAAAARILRADIRSALVVAIAAIDVARDAPTAGDRLPGNKSPQ